MSPAEREPQPTEGERCLEMLGYSEYIGKEVSYVDSQGQTRTIQAQDFLDVCGPHARPRFKVLERMDPNNEKHKIFFDAARASLEKHLGIVQSVGKSSD